VLQLVHGLGDTGAAPCRSGADKIAFIGSTATAKKVMATCAETLTPFVAECGGKDALIVDADAELDAMPGQLDTIRRHIADGLADGGRAALGGAEAVQPPYVRPTILVDVPEDSTAVREETFGPVLVVNRVRDADEGIARTNAVAYEPPGSGASTATMGCANSPGRSPSRRAARRRCCLSGRLSATRPRPRGVSWPSSAWYTAPRGCRTRQARPGVSAVDHVASGLGGPTGGINAACPWGRGQWPSRRRPSRGVPPLRDRRW